MTLPFTCPLNPPISQALYVAPPGQTDSTGLPFIRAESTAMSEVKKAVLLVHMNRNPAREPVSLG